MSSPNYFPSWLKPEVFAGIDFPAFLGFLNVIRWYGLMYIIGLTVFLLTANYVMKKESANLKTLNKERMDNIFFAGVIGLILGGRIFYCLVYDWPYFSQHLLQVIVPFNFSTGQFTGFAGMSYHGAVIGIAILASISVKRQGVDFREAFDIIFISAPLGYSFGRLGNFINAELYGRITSNPFGMIFPNAEKLPLTLPDVQNILTKLQWTVNEGSKTITTATGEVLNNLVGGMIINGNVVTSVNLPRHPSQLYEFLLEGIVLFLVMWFIFRRFNFLKGYQSTVYLCGYATARFIAEFFRQPDYQFADHASGKYVGTIAGFLSMGQILSILMFLSGIALALFLKYLYKPKKLSLLSEVKKK